MTQKDSFAVDTSDNILHLRRMLSSLLELQSSASLTTSERNKVKKSILALNAGIEALQVQVYA